GTFTRSFGYLPLLALLCVPAAALGAESASQASAAPAAGVLASVKGQVSIDRPGARSVTGTIGMRLMPGDGLRVGPGSSATIYLAGGSIVRVPAGGRIEIPRASIGGSGAPIGAGNKAGGGAPAGSGAPAGASAMSARSVEVLEPGLWILNDPEGSVLLSAMRGEDDAWGRGGGSGA